MGRPRVLVVGSHDLHRQQLAARSDQAEHPADGHGANGRREGLHGEHLDDEIERADQVRGQGQQIGDLVGDLGVRVPLAGQAHRGG